MSVKNIVSHSTSDICATCLVYVNRKYVMINGKYPLKVILDEQRGVGPNDIALNGKQVSI